MSDLQHLALGKTATTMCPSGRVFLVREQNGNDDDLISNPVARKDLSNYDNFLLAVCLKEMVGDQEKPVTMSTITNLLSNDRTHLLFFSRIHTLGNEMKFTFDWGPDPDRGGKFPYTEGLSQYLHDYTKDFPNKGDEGYFKYKIPPYPENAYEPKEFTTSYGKVLRFSLYNRNSEKYTLKLDPEQMTTNAQLKAMELSLKGEGNTWQRIENFAMFPKKEMLEIHKLVANISNTQYMPMTEITHPKTNEVIEFPILASEDFFFPTEV
jgi:hypothetical protein